MATTPAMEPRYNHWTVSGEGIALPQAHFAEFLRRKPAINWLEIQTDQLVDDTGPALHTLEQIRREYPLTLHGSRMSLGSLRPLDQHYLHRLKLLANRLECLWISDHICFSGIEDQISYARLPLPYTEEALEYLSARIIQVQEYLGQRILVENPACYLDYQHATLTEGEFLRELCERADCYLLLDVTNFYLNEHNLGRNALEMIRLLPPQRVKLAHLSGFEDRGDYLHGSHSSPIGEPVWSLYSQLQPMLPNIPALVEWDQQLPTLSRLLQETARITQIIRGQQQSHGSLL